MPEGDKNQRPQLFSDELVARLGDKLADQIMDQICRGMTTPPAQPQRPTSLCLEIIVFELDEDLLRKLVRCVFTQFNPVQLAEEIVRTINRVNRFLNGHSTTAPNPSALPICKYDLLQNILAQISRLEDRILNTCHLRERIYEEILLNPIYLPHELLTNIDTVTRHAVIQNFRQNLIEQYDNFALKNCNKVSCINSDLEFLADQIKQFTINFPAGEIGIIEIADAAGNVAEAFHSEDHDFDQIYDAVDAVSKVIEDLAEFYQVKIAQLSDLLDNANSGCPVPIRGKETLPTIPDITPTPGAFPIVDYSQVPITTTTPFPPEIPITPITPITPIVPITPITPITPIITTPTIIQPIIP